MNPSLPIWKRLISAGEPNFSDTGVGLFRKVPFITGEAAHFQSTLHENNLLMLYKNLPYREDDNGALIRRNSFLFKRMCIDGLSGIAYLLQGKWQFFKAVINAHSDYRKMNGAAKISPRLISYTNASSRNLSGAYDKSIILKYFTGKREFSKLNIRG